MKPKFYPQIKMMDPAELIPAGFNPAGRTDIKTLQPLIDAITRLGGVVVPIIISRDKRIGDGHRRVAAAIHLGLSEIPVIELPISLQEVWSLANLSARRIDGRQWVESHYLGLSIEHLPNSNRRELAQIKNLIGDDGIRLLVEKGMTSSVVGLARKLSKYIDPKPTKSLIGQCLLWLIEHNQQYPARKAMESEMEPAIVRYAIVNGQRLGKGKSAQ